jgi:hypothetical protein
MIKLPEVMEFRYSEPQWNEIKAVVRDARLDVDQITRRSMEAVVSMYLPQRALNRQRLSRDELKTLRDDAENLRGRIARALAMQVNVKNAGPLDIPLRGVDRDMLAATSDYFAELRQTLDHQIKHVGTRTRRDSARKPERDVFWTDLLLLWCDIGGKPHGLAAARFLIAASKPTVSADASIKTKKPVGAGASIKTVLRWLDRGKETVSNIIEDARSVVGPRR